MTIQQRIQELKREKDAIIFAHNYQLPEIQDVAEHVGDSLELARIASNVKESLIVFCGVRFMAETAKILSPQKKVIIPDPGAICPMAKMIDPETVRQLRREHPDAVFVAYINTTAEVKAEVDYIVTSANAVKVVESVPPDRKVVFLPDKYLGAYVKYETGRNIILYSGFCPTHQRILREDIILAREKWPRALVLGHPECAGEVLELCDYVGGTSGILKYARESEAQEFIIGTEQGMLHRLNKDIPGRKFYSPSELNICPNMKKNTLGKLLHSLETETVEVNVPAGISEKAYRSLSHMLVN